MDKDVWMALIANLPQIFTAMASLMAAVGAIVGAVLASRANIATARNLEHIRAVGDEVKVVHGAVNSQSQRDKEIALAVAEEEKKQAIATTRILAYQEAARAAADVRVTVMDEEHQTRAASEARVAALESQLAALRAHLGHAEPPPE